MAAGTVSQTDSLESFHSPGTAQSLANAAVVQRQHHILECAGSWKKIELLENEPYLLAPNGSQLAFVHAHHLLAVDAVNPFARNVQAAQDR